MCIMSTIGIQTFRGYSLVDITATGTIRDTDSESLARNQQRNWETLLQCIGLRTQPLNILQPLLMPAVDLKILEFGDFYSGEHNVWVWQWSIEREDVYDLPGRPLGGLLQDLEQVPIITGLTETARFMLPIFYPHGTIKNIYITQSTIE
jgi:hypothetical protein